VATLTVPEDQYHRDLGDVLRRFRVHRGWTRKVLADRLHVLFGVDISRPTIATYEHGTRRISVRRMHEVCVALEVEPSDVFNALASATGRRVDVLVVDLAVLSRCDLAPIQQWARSQRRANPDRHTVDLSADAIEHLSVLCGLEIVETVRVLQGKELDD
jgi:transcriptional regulator with XRE-family HTH domain